MSEQTRTILGKCAYDAFRCKLDQPGKPNEALRRLLQESRKLVANDDPKPRD